MFEIWLFKLLIIITNMFLNMYHIAKSSSDSIKFQQDGHVSKEAATLVINRNEEDWRKKMKRNTEEWGLSTNEEEKILKKIICKRRICSKKKKKAANERKRRLKNISLQRKSQQKNNLYHS